MARSTSSPHRSATWRHHARALDVLGTVPLIAAEDTRLTRRLLVAPRDRDTLDRASTRGAVRPGSRRCSRTRDGADLALVTDAGTPSGQRPRARPRGGVGRRGRPRRPDPGASAVLARLRHRASRAHAGRSRGSYRVRVGSGASVWPRSPPDPRGAVLFEAPTRVGRDAARPGRCVWRRSPGSGRAGADEAPRADRAGPLGMLADGVRRRTIPARGEFVIVVGMGRCRDTDARKASGSGQAAVERLVGEGIARGDAASRVASGDGSATAAAVRTGQGRQTGPLARRR